MPWYGFIHPAVAVATIAYGLVLAQTGLSRLNDWDFPLRRQRERSVLFLLLCVVNFAVGLLAVAVLHGRGMKLHLTLHLPLAVAVLVLALANTLVIFTPSQAGKLSRLARWHPGLSVTTLALVLTQGFLALLSLLSHS